MRSRKTVAEPTIDSLSRLGGPNESRAPAPRVLSDALRCVARGWRVLPLFEPNPEAPSGCSCSNSACKSPGKHPRTINGVHNASADAAQITGWFERWPTANLGVATGETVSGQYLVVVDVDPRHGGTDSLAQLEREHGSLSTTRVRTGGDGDHYYYLTDEPVRGGKLRSGIDIKGTGGYVVGPGSVHSSGKMYEMVDDGMPMAAPDWLLERLRRVGRQRPFRPAAQRPELTAPSAALAVDLLHEMDNRENSYHEFVAVLHFFKGSIPKDQWDAPEVLDAVFAFGMQYEENCPEWIQGKWDSIRVPDEGWRALLRAAADQGIDTLPYQSVRYPSDHPASAESEFGPDPSLAGVAPTPAPVVLDPADPHAAAERLLFCEFMQSGVRTLRTQGGVPYVFDSGAYREITHEELDARLWTFLSSARRIQRGGASTAPFKPTVTHISNVRAALMAITYEAGQAPCWLGGDLADLPAHELVSMANGILHVPTRRLVPPTPRFFTRNALPFPWSAPAPTPAQWIAFLDQIFEGDREQIGTLQEIFGYLLLPDTSQQKAFLITGPRRSGKGTINRVLTELLGRENVCSPTFASLQTEFGLAPLVGKLVASISDARLSARADKAAIAERILTVSGEDAVMINRKYREAVSVRLATRFLIFTNEAPSFADASGALASRFIVLKLERSFLGKEDLGLTSRLLQELPGIFAWALEGLDRLGKRGRFIQPVSAADVIEDLEDLASPITAFIRDCCVVGPQQEVLVADLFEAWRRWCATGGRNPGSLQTFGRDLRAAHTAVRRSRPRTLDGGRQPTYVGIGLRTGHDRYDFSDLVVPVGGTAEETA